MGGSKSNIKFRAKAHDSNNSDNESISKMGDTKVNWCHLIEITRIMGDKLDIYLFL